MQLLSINHGTLSWLFSISLEQWHNIIFYFLVLSLVLGIIASTLCWLIGKKDKRVNRVFFISVSSLILGLVSTILLEIISAKIESKNEYERLALETRRKAVENSLKMELSLSSEKISELEKSDENFRKELEETHERLSRSKNPIVPRSLSSTQRTKLLNTLTNGPKDSIIIRC